MHCHKCKTNMEDLEIYEVIIKRYTVCEGFTIDASIIKADANRQRGRKSG